MAAELTLRQAKFTQEYLRHGNATKAAKIAGYSPTSAHQRGSELVRNPKVRKHIQKLTRRFELDSERVLLRLDNLSAKAEEEGLLAVSVKAEELLGRALGLFVTQNVNLNVDITSQHIEAIRALSARGARRAKNNAGDDAKVIDGQATTAPIVDAAVSDNVSYGKYNTVVDQGVASDNAHSETPDADGDNI